MGQGQATIQQVFKERESELNELHSRFMLGSRHNASVSHKQQLLQTIALVSLSTEEYRTLNDQQRGRLAQRETKYFTSDTAQTLVDRATSLLDSAEWSDVAAGLAVLIGRRISEILLSNFSPHTPWSILFSEISKKPQPATGLELELFGTLFMATMQS